MPWSKIVSPLRLSRVHAVVIINRRSCVSHPHSVGYWFTGHIDSTDWITVCYTMCLLYCICYFEQSPEHRWFWIL